MGQAWLKCKVHRGMFSDELNVVVTAADGEVISFFVPRDSVRGEVDHEGNVHVGLVRDDSAVWAVLPNETRSLVAIEVSQLVAA